MRKVFTSLRHTLKHWRVAECFKQDVGWLWSMWAVGLSPTTQTGKQPSLIFADDIGAVKKEAWLGFEHILIAHNRLAPSITPQSHTILTNDIPLDTLAPCFSSGDTVWCQTQFKRCLDSPPLSLLDRILSFSDHDLLNRMMLEELHTLLMTIAAIPTWM